MSEPTVILFSAKGAPTEHVEIDPIKAFVSGVLGLDPALDAYWTIRDYYYDESDPNSPQLVLAHYNDKYDPLNRLHAPLSKIRGVIVDLDTGAVVASSYGYTHSLPCYEPLEEIKSAQDPLGVIRMSTQTVNYINSYELAPEEPAKIGMGIRQFDRPKIKLAPGYEATMIRLFKWHDRVFFSTHKKIDATQSKWGDRTSFFELWTKLGGPDPATLFGNEPYSPFCYNFLVVDNQVRLASSTKDNRIILIGVKKVWSEEDYAHEDGPYEWPEGFKIRLPYFSPDTSPFSPNLDHSMVMQTEVSVEMANKFLFPATYATPFPDTPEAKAYGAKDFEMVIRYAKDSRQVEDIYFKAPPQAYADERLAGGDFLIAYVEEPNGETTVYRLESPAFQYRAKITVDDPNLYFRFVTKMVDFIKATPAELLEEYPRYAGVSLKEPTDRMNLWWSIYYDAVAPYFKEKVDDFYTQYNKDVRVVANFILHEFERISDPEELKRISDQTRMGMQRVKGHVSDLTQSRRGRKEEQIKKGDAPFVHMMNTLYNETGKSFYRMIKTVHDVEKYRTQKRLVTVTAEQVLTANQ